MVEEGVWCFIVTLGPWVTVTSPTHTEYRVVHKKSVE